MPEKIKAEEQSLVDVFNDKYLFEIPVFQRPYAWTTEQVNDLLSDLTDAMGRDSESPYFLGSIVLIKEAHKPHSLVVDGQQRLTTLTMLICVLRDLFGDDEKAKKLDPFIRQVGNDYMGTEDEFRLSLRELDKDFFRKNVQEMGNLSDFLEHDPVRFSDSGKHIFENVKRLKQLLESQSEDQRDAFAKYVIQKCYLVVVSATDVDSAYRIFSVMNDRGLSLSPTDILKAEIIGKLPPHAQNDYSAKWEGIEEGLGRDDFRDLFTHIRMIYRKDKLRGTLQREFEESVLNGGKYENFIDDVLEPYASIYETVSRASFQSTEGAEKVNASLQHLSRLPNFDWIPPAMAFFHRNESDRGGLTRFLSDLERFSYGLYIRGAYSNERLGRYVRVLNAIEQDDDLFASSGALQLSEDDKSEILSRLEGPLYSQMRVLSPLLLRLDSLLADAGASYQHSTISIEHVLPRNPADDSQWIEWFPDADEREYWTHRLANLVLLSRRKNSSASNYDFELKKHGYFQQNGTTPFALTTQVVNESEWTPEVLECRQRQLIETIKKEWRLG